MAEDFDLGTTRDGRPRQKKWASRGRTGCFTCRARRVKCDELKPICRRCIHGGRQCGGYGVTLPSRSTALNVVFDAKTPVMRGAEWLAQSVYDKRRYEPVYEEVEPPQWDYLESIRYYFCVLKPGIKYDLHAPADPRFNDANYIPASFICTVLVNQITQLSKHCGRVLRLGDSDGRALTPTWSSLYRHLSEHMRILNECIEDRGPYGGRQRVFYCIMRLMNFDLALQEASWPTQARGFFAFVRHMGGVQAVFKLPLPPVGSFRVVFLKAAMANTTSPAGQQITDINAYTDDDVRTIMGPNVGGYFPCPMELLLCIIHLTRLRADVFHRRLPERTIASLAQTLLARVDNFNAVTWAAEMQLTDVVAPALARIYQVATRVYAILTLPPSATRSPGKQTLYKEELVRLMRGTWPQLTYPSSLRWPLIVAGVAAGQDGDAAAQRFVEKRMLDISAVPIETCVPLRTVEILRAFWRDEGRTRWEDCFVEMFPCMG